MQMLPKRIAALALALVLLWPAGLRGAAWALESSNLVRETGVIVQRSPDAAPALPSSYQSSYAAATRYQGDNHNTSWAYAAVAALEASAGRQGIGATFSEGHMYFALSSDSGNTVGFDRRYNGPGNRNMVTAYLMRGLLGGPVTNYLTVPEQTSVTNLQTFSAIAKEQTVSGVVYIPALPVTADAAARALYMSRIKQAAIDSGAVAASLLMDERYLYDRKNGSGKVYCYTGTAGADHTVAILGWDDGVQVDATVTTGTGDSAVTTTTTHTGAFWVRDSLTGLGSTYWVSYDVALSGLYCIEGFRAKDLFQATYEYDPFGFTSATGFNASTAWYANVFTAATAAEEMTAVSLFLTGENSSYEIYYIYDYNETKDLTNGLKPANLLLSGSKPLPGYYTLPLAAPRLMPAKGKKCALVVKVTNAYDTAPIPVQSTSLYKAGNAGRSYMSSDGDAWMDAYAQNQSVVCLKAHVDKDIDIPLTGVGFPQTEDKVTAIGGADYPTLYVAPGQSYNLGPMWQPLNATDTDKDKTVWLLGDAGAANFGPFPDGKETLEEGEEPPDLTLDPATGLMKVYKDALAGIYTVKVTVQNKDGVSHTAVGVVEIRSVAVEKVELDKKTLSLKAGSTSTLKAVVTPSDATKHDIEWVVARDYNASAQTYTPYALPYDAAEPYREGAPIAAVKDGKVTALSDGTCYIYARVTQENSVPIVTEPCVLTIDKVEPTGVTLSKKAVTLSVGTRLTLTATVKPASASNKRVLWSSDKPSVVEVDPVLGILSARAEGSAVITATNAKNHTYTCTVTVTAMPSLVLGKGKSSTLSLTGARSSETVKWEFTPVADVEAPLTSAYLTGALSGSKLKVTGAEVGAQMVRATQTVESFDEAGDPVSSRVVCEQLWRVETVVSLTRMEMQDQDGAVIKKAALCVDAAAPSRNMSVTLRVLPMKPTDATELGYEWTSKNPDIASVSVISDPTLPQGALVLVQAHKTGSTKITATSYNGKKKLSLSIKVLEFPKTVTLNKTSPQALPLGKTLSFKGKTNVGKTVNKEVRYELIDGGGNASPHTAADPIATVDARGKVKALREGVVKLVARGAPFNGAAPYAEVTVECKVPATGVALSISPSVLKIGETAVVSARVLPENATVQNLTLTLTNSSLGTLQNNGDGTWTLTAKSAGTAKLRAAPGDNPKKYKSVTVTVTGW